MKKQETINLFNKGVDSWDNWAKQLLSERCELQKSGDWIDGNSHEWNDKTRDWHDRARVDFSGHKFPTRPSFTRYRFPGEALFRDARFPQGASFNDVSFPSQVTFSKCLFGGQCGFTRAAFGSSATFRQARFRSDIDFVHAVFQSSVSFEHASFGGEAHFSNVSFSGPAAFRYSRFSEMGSFNDSKFLDDGDFRDTVFSRRVSFRDVGFQKVVRFDQGTFQNTAWFRGSGFENEALFRGIRGRGAFTLHEAKFSRVPDFTEAHFDEAPLLDAAGLVPGSLSSSESAGPEIPARWRALRRLAIQGHDHERELEFLKGEIIARRGFHDRRKHLRYWAGRVYEVVSDFGRSIRRPFCYLIGSFVVFATVYLVLSWTSGHCGSSGPVGCVAHDGSRLYSALAWSVHNAVPFAGAGFSPQEELLYECLYGKDAAGIVPHFVAAVGVVQFFTSSILIFLLGLGVRNRFRIK